MSTVATYRGHYYWHRRWEERKFPKRRLLCKQRDASDNTVTNVDVLHLDALTASFHLNYASNGNKITPLCLIKHHAIKMYG
jgi:hypothetical protein